MKYLYCWFGLLLLLPSISYAEYNLHQIENYLNHIKTFTADFKQYENNGNIKHGKFFLSKPGKMKWEYSSPTRVVIIANDSNMVYCNYELEEVSYFATKSLLSRLLSQDKINFKKDVKIDEYIEGDKYSKLILSAKENDKESNLSKLTLIFEHEKSGDGGSLRLSQINFVDESGHESEVLFFHSKVNQHIDKSEFVFRNPNFLKMLK